MRISIVTPAPPASRYGNRITAVRWAKILRRLGNRVSISQRYDSKSSELLIALHARRSHQSIIDFRRQNPDGPIILALTGTDLYRDIRTSHLAQKSLETATKIVVLQPKAIEALQPSLRAKTCVIYQSVAARQAWTDASGSTAGKRASRAKASEGSNGRFDVCVIGHLRAVKDPFRTAMAARLLPDSSRIRVLHVGGEMSDAMAARARQEMRLNVRYQWLGEQPRWRVTQILAKSSLCVLSSRMEGGANVLAEAIVGSVPILASRIDGNIGILGADYPGYFEVGNTKQLARLLILVETSSEYLAELRERVKKLASLFYPEREERAWSDLVGELVTEASRLVR